MSHWAADITGYLAHLKATRPGIDYDDAWRIAMAAHPPRGRDAGAATPRLFDEDGRRPDTLVSFHKRVCEHAWEGHVDAPGSGNGPALRFFRVELLRDLDMSGPARRVAHGAGRIRQAA